MQIADLYIRVSTDDQADNGYSQRDQEERLRKFCDINCIEIGKIYYEDHSAKTFIRPQWTTMINTLQNVPKEKPGLLLFTKWDRFSRNTSEAYQMIDTVKELNIEPQAIEQPLDLGVPENKLMLAFYLATPEVENDRRALNVFHGMRRARKEGRYMGNAPIGYDNKSHEDGSKYIMPNPVEAPFIKWIFEQIAEGVFSPAQILRMVNEQGFEISRNNFYREIRNPLYCGKIVIKPYEREEEQWINGNHEAIISEALFYEAQKELKKPISKKGVATVKNKNFPLRGFLKCSKCDKMFTASNSKGRKNLYAYYHAQSEFGCGCRYKAEKINNLILNDLKKYIPKKGTEDFQKEILMDLYLKTHLRNEENDHVLKQIKELNARILKFKELFLSGKIDLEDYNFFKNKCEVMLNEQEANLTPQSLDKKTSLKSVKRMISEVIDGLSRLKEIYEKGGNSKKQAIIGTIYRDKLSYDENGLRTNKINEGVALIPVINSYLSENRNGRDRKPLQLSHLVLRAGIEPALRLREQDFKSCVSTSSTI